MGGWQTLWLLLLALTTIAANDLPSCRAWASDDGKWSVGGRGQVSCTCDGSQGQGDVELLLSGKSLAIENITNTVQYTEPSAEESVQNTYECSWNKFPVSSVQVRVFAVLNVTDLSCRFDVRDKLNCSFSRADGGEFQKSTHYELRSGQNNCTAEQGKDMRMHCMLNTTGYAYAYHMPSLTFTLIMTSDLGGRTQTQQIELRGDSMYVPKWPSSKPRPTTVSNNQTCLAWDRAKDLLERSLEWVVELRPRLPEIPPLNLTLPGGEMTDQMILTFCFPHPPQGFQVFDVRLKCHIKGNNTIWSEYYPEFEITTNATIPARPPEFMPNGFSFNKDTDELTVLWFPLDRIYHNGPNLTYDVYCNGKKASKTYGRSATFSNWDASEPGNVTVRSRNSEGASVDNRWLWVPAISDGAERRATNLDSKYLPNGSLSLTWEKPEDSDQLLGYTIYWCDASKTIHQFCQDGVTTNSISLDDGERQEYIFNSSMAHQDIALEPIYGGRTSGGLSILLDLEKYSKAFTLSKARILEGFGALLVLGLVILTVWKLIKMNDIEPDLPDMGDLYKKKEAVEPKFEPESESPRSGVPRNPEIYCNSQRRENIELQTLTEEVVVIQTEPEFPSYLPMDPLGRNGDIRPPSPRINPSNGYVIPSPPRLIPNSEGYIARPPPPPSPPAVNNNPNSNGYVTAPPPRLNPNNNGYVNPPSPRFIPNSDGYINPSPSRG